MRPIESVGVIENRPCHVAPKTAKGFRHVCGRVVLGGDLTDESRSQTPIGLIVTQTRFASDGGVLARNDQMFEKEVILHHGDSFDLAFPDGGLREFPVTCGFCQNIRVVVVPDIGMVEFFLHRNAVPTGMLDGEIEN